MALDYLFQGKPPPSTTSTTTSTSSMPDWYQDYMRGVFGKANSVAAEPYYAYGGQRLEGFTPDQSNAFDLARGNVGSWKPGMENATASANRGAAPWSAGDRSNFMSPFMGGVTDEISRLGNQNLMENVLPKVQDEFVGAGQHGSQRYMDFMGRAVRDSTREIAGQQSLALQRGYETAGTEYGNWADRALTGAKTQSGLAGLESQYGTADAAQLEAVGSQEQQFGQKNLDVGYGDFLEQRNYPRGTVDWMNSAVRGMNPPTSTSSTTTAPYQGYMGPSPLMQLASVYGLGRGSGMFRHGGRVPPRRYYRGGGPVRMAWGGALRQLPQMMGRQPMGQMPLNRPMMGQMPLNRPTMGQMPLNRPTMGQMPLNRPMIAPPGMPASRPMAGPGPMPSVQRAPMPATYSRGGLVYYARP